MHYIAAYLWFELVCIFRLEYEMEKLFSEYNIDENLPPPEFEFRGILFKT